MWWLLITELAVTLLIVLAACKYYVHMLQLESYQLDGYLRFLKKSRDRVLGWTFRIGVIFMVISIVLPMFISLVTNERYNATIISHMMVAAGFAAFGGWHAYLDHHVQQKKALVVTQRVKRLIAVLTAVIIVLELIFMFILTHEDEDTGFMVMYLNPCLLLIAVPYIVLIAAWAAQPIEKRINARFFKQAQEKLASHKNLIKIGVTGSYGKTSTKFSLATILSVKYRVLVSPSSVNTPMGLSKLINEKLDPSHQVFVAEMGARHRGDIKELVELVHPTVGLITTVGPQHLETFGTVENVARTKFELIEGIGNDGIGVFFSDGAWVDKLYSAAKCKKFLCGTDNGQYAMKAENIEVGPFGCRFTLNCANGESMDCEMSLLGRHNICNVLLACCAAYQLGLTLEEIARGLRLLKPVEHRLQLIPSANGMYIIDDAFNSNPVGAKEAVTILSSFPGRHVVVTPGFVEMGENEAKFNYELGKHIALTCDEVILVGPKHTAPIKQALIESGFEKSAIHTVKTIPEASALIERVASAGDSVLFENDLPDNYNE